jgi:hypothetical protein
MTESQAAVEWLESGYMYEKDDFRHPDVRENRIHPDDQYSSYMANFRDDVCHPEFCGTCTSAQPTHITSVDWDPLDDTYWLEHAIPGRWEPRTEIYRANLRRASELVIERD